jgi:hypothetical protein
MRRGLNFVPLALVGGLITISSIHELHASPAQKSRSASQPAPPEIASLLKLEIDQRVIQKHDIYAHASLDQDESSHSKPPLKTYSFYAAMLTRSGISRTHRILTDYSLYSKLIPYIESAKYNASTHLLDLQGGIWKWKLHSVLRFDERSDRWIHYQIVGGHFTGLSGDIFFEPKEDSSGVPGTLVYMRGEQKGYSWPPAFIIEQGAQIVFEFTARRMRSYIDDSSSGRTQGPVHDDKIPQPRSHL